MILTDAILKIKAMYFAEALGINTAEKMEFTASEGWLHRFKLRHKIKQYFQHGEASSVPVQDLPALRVKFQDIIRGWDLSNVFNCDETGLYWRMAPNKSLAQSVEKGFKRDKARITVLLTCNTTSENCFIELCTFSFLFTDLSVSFQALEVEAARNWNSGKVTLLPQRGHD